MMLGDRGETLIWLSKAVARLWCPVARLRSEFISFIAFAWRRNPSELESGPDSAAGCSRVRSGEGRLKQGEDLRTILLPDATLAQQSHQFMLCLPPGPSCRLLG